MEPNDKKTETDELRAEGVDVVGSGVAEENEFSTGSDTSDQESEPASAPISTPVPSQPAAPVRERPILPPMPDMPFVAPVRQAPPITPATPAAMPEPAAMPITAPAQPSTPASTGPLKNDPSIKQLRTFKSDAEEAIRYKNVSTADIALAEQKKRESTPIVREETHSSTGIYMAFVAIVIVVLGGGWYFWFNASQPKVEETSPTVTVQTIIPYTRIALLGTDPKSDLFTLMGAKLAASNPGLGNVYALVPTNDITTGTPISVTDLLAGTKAPNRLVRSLADSYMVGTYMYTANSPFIILKDTFYQNAFSAMLNWEVDLRNDFLPLIRVSHPDETLVTTKTDVFEDILVSNINVRVLKNSAGEIILAYAFADNDTIVIATNLDSLKYVLDRLLAVRTIQ